MKGNNVSHMIESSLSGLHDLAGSDIKNIFIILVDITGYTKFIKLHKISLLHAEKIIGELMESILAQVQVPVMAHEILGDAISLYAVDDGTTSHADQIYQQLQQYFNAFRETEAKLISACSLCECDACRQVNKLSLKAILHHGEAAFTMVHQIRKISGEDIIISHRLLKNNVKASEYILMTSAFAEKTSSLDPTTLESHEEGYDDIGKIKVYVKNLDTEKATAAPMSFRQKLKGMLAVDAYMIGRFFYKNKKQYRNLPA